MYPRALIALAVALFAQTAVIASPLEVAGVAPAPNAAVAQANKKVFVPPAQFAELAAKGNNAPVYEEDCDCYCYIDILGLICIGSEPGSSS
ncbi:hypothetical protein C8R46DRAFT_1209067 [Mycena filopes]|nr:hypothetical protein C8R46DRAFT_1209067 [Mycena filopes]